ncbi:MAG: YafY family protein [Pseudomonadota bacterium]
MARSDRLLQLIQCLRTETPPVTAEFLSKELGVSVRTLYRDIEALRRAGALIDGEAGFGYTLQEDPALPPMLFTRDEMEAIVLGLREVFEVADPVLAKAAENALSKLKASLPDRMQAEFQHAVLYAKRFQPRPLIRIDIETLRRETREERAVDLRYESLEGQATSRRVLPLAIMFFDRALILVAWCKLREDYRSFRIDRIRELQTTDDSFRPGRVSLLRTYMDRMSRWDHEDDPADIN